jgi:cell division transport system permease protein
MAEAAASVEGVSAVEIVSRKEALARFRQRLGNAELFASFDENPLPISLEIRLAAAHRTREGFRAVRERLEGLPQIESLAGGEAWVEGYSRALSLVRDAALGVGSVLGAAALLMVGITIRLAVYARRSELEILSLVGASRSFLRTPFLVEGLLQGAGGGLVGLALLSTVFGALVPRMRDALALFLGWTEPAFLAPDQMIALVALGAGFGLVGAAAAVWSTRLA